MARLFADLDKITDDEEPLLSLHLSQSKNFKKIEGFSSISGIVKGAKQIVDLAEKWKKISEKRLADWSG